MKFHSLFIKDFGIFNNQKMEDIAPGLVVIGGLNRAGKSTFFHLLRYLPYGIPRKKGIPPARENYDIEGIAVFDRGRKVHLHLAGYGEPVVNELESEQNNITTSELYNKLDSFSYHQLFTISLNELQKLPSGISNNEEERLNSILMGAGFSDFMLLPQMDEYFNKEAERIGGKRGQPDVWEFKQYYQLIKQGLKIRETALKQVDNYHQKLKEKNNITQQINTLKEELPKLEGKIIRLDALKSIFNDYIQYITLKEELQGYEIKNYPIEKLEIARNLKIEYQSYLDEYQEKLIQYESIAGNKKENTMEIINSHKGEIEFYFSEIAGYREKINNLLGIKKGLERRKGELLLEIRSINKDWNSFEDILKIRIDKVEREQLYQIMETYQEIKLEVEKGKDKFQELSEHLNVVRKRLEEINYKEAGLFSKFNWFYILSVIFLIMGIALYFINPYLIIISLTGIPGFGFFLFLKYSLYTSQKSSSDNLSKEINEIKIRKEIIQNKINIKNEELNPYLEKIEEIRNNLGFSSNCSLEMLKEGYRDINDLQIKIREWVEENKQYQLFSEQVNEELTPLLELVNRFTDLVNLKLPSASNIWISGKYKLLFNAVEYLYQLLGIVQELMIIKRKTTMQEVRIEELLTEECRGKGSQQYTYLECLEDFIQNGEKYKGYIGLKEKKDFLEIKIQQAFRSDRARWALEEWKSEPINDEKQIREAVDTLFNKYVSVEDVANTMDKTSIIYHQKEDELKEYGERYKLLEKELSELASTDKLEEAQKIIAEGRIKLAPLAEEYAVNRTAAFILKKVREEFLQKTKNELLSGASQYLQKITRREYNEIMPPAEVSGDFTVLKNNHLKEEVGVLSRGTIEQLYFSIRISRIREINPPLPVIIDDGFVNFDHYHLEEALQIILQLSKTNQVFILTCHPYLIDYIYKSSYKAQYWVLESGKFLKTEPLELLQHLTGGKE